MSLHPDQVLQSLKSGDYKPVYFLQGEEAFYIDQISDYIEEKCLNAADKGFNQTILYGKDVTMAQILTNARRFPMMAERQVVIVKEAKDIQDLNKEEGQKLLINYLEQAVPSTVLVFAHKHKKVDGRRPLAKVLKDKSVLVTTTVLRDYELPPWIEKFVKEKGFTINQNSVHMLAEYIGTNLERLSNEIDKMIVNMGESKSINEDLIQKYVGISKEYNVFELQKAISFRDVLKANKIGALYSYYSKLLILHTAKDQSDKGLAMAMGTNPYFIKEYKVAAKNYPVGKVMLNIGVLKIADLRSKGVDAGAMGDGEIFKELVYRLMH
jgi:DNA polymerase-3 subunit delta